MKTDQQFWEDIVTALVPVVLNGVIANEPLKAFLAQEKVHSSVFAADLAARTADELLQRRNRRIDGARGTTETPENESAATS